MKYVGIDLHKKTSVICIVNKERKVLQRHKFHNGDMARIAQFFRELGLFKFAVEASGSYEWLVKLRAGCPGLVVLDLTRTKPSCSPASLVAVPANDGTRAPAIIQHTLTVGTTLVMTENISTSIGYAYGFPNSISGSVEQLPNARVGIDMESHALLFNLQIKFGCPWAMKQAACSTCTP